jgi:hypothetical protein
MGLTTVSDASSADLPVSRCLNCATIAQFNGHARAMVRHLHETTAQIRVLYAHAEDADWQEVAQIVLHIDPTSEPDRARRAYDSHLARARWITKVGYRLLLRGGSR